MTHTALRAGALALGLMSTVAWADSVTIRDANQLQRNIRAYSLPDGSLAPGHIITSPITGQPYNMLNGQPVAPAIAAGYPVQRSLVLAVAGTVYTAMPANSSRKAGYCQSSYANGSAVVYISDTGTASSASSALTNDAELVAGNSFDLVQHGYVEQGAVTAVSSVAGALLICHEVQ